MSTTEITPGSLIQDRYRVLQQLGQGGMGKVFVVQDTRLGNKTIALKALSLEAVPPAERAEALQDFQREAQILAQLDHPGLTKVTDLFSEGAQWFIVMEFVPGKTLDAIAQERGGRLAEADALSWSLQICDVLDYLHRCWPPVIFRDLKPGNIILMPDGRIKLIDFGIARFFKPGKSRDTRNMGTPGFAAPEQYGKGQSDGRSDIYSLGVTLHHLLTGYDPEQTPFSLPPARTLNPALSPALEKVIARATQIQVEKRYQTIAEMRDALVVIIQGASPLPIGAQPASQAGTPAQQGAKRAKPFAPRNPPAPAPPAPAAPLPASIPKSNAVPAVPTPTAVHAAQVEGGVRVSWQPPADPALVKPITGYLVIANPSGQNVRAARYATEAIVTGLLPNLAYTFTVVAETSSGVGPPSAPSNTVKLGSARPPAVRPVQSGRRSMRRASLGMFLLTILLLPLLVRMADLELTRFVSQNNLPIITVDIVLAALMLLPYHLTLRPAAVTLGAFLVAALGIAPGTEINWMIYALAAEGVFFMSWWRDRGLPTGAIAAAAGPIVALIIGIGIGTATLPDVFILAAGGALSALIGYIIGAFTRIGH